MAAIACDFIVRLDSTPPLLMISAKSSSLIEIQWQSRSPGYVVQERSFIDQHSSDWIVSKDHPQKRWLKPLRHYSTF